MKYFNVSLFGLQGRLHPALSNVTMSRHVKLMRIHVKMILGDYTLRSEKSGGPSDCDLCHSGQPDTLCHLLGGCDILYNERQQILKEYSTLLMKTKNCLRIEEFSSSEELLCQFILDPTSFNLTRRVHMTDPVLPDIFKISRDYCHLVDKRRTTILGRSTNTC